MLNTLLSLLALATSSYTLLQLHNLKHTPGPQGQPGPKGDSSGPAERELLARWAHKALKFSQE